MVDLDPVFENQKSSFDHCYSTLNSSHNTLHLRPYTCIHVTDVATVQLKPQNMIGENFRIAALALLGPSHVKYVDTKFPAKNI